MNVATLPLESDSHVVGFYVNDDELVQQVTEYLTEGAALGSGALVVATAAHCKEIETHLATHRMEVGSRVATRTVRFVDAAAALDEFMIGAAPNPGRFASFLGDLLDNGQGRVRIYGEMVQLLWEAGNVNGAIQLEGLWNDLALGHDFTLYCAYRLETICADSDAREAVCDLHSAIVGTPPSVPVHALSADMVETAELAPTLDAPSAARHFTAATLQRWEWTGDHKAAALIANELSENAVVHARSPFRLSLTRTGETIRISVADLHPGGPVTQSPTSHDASGRGLRLVTALARTWGCNREETGKEIWADVAPGLRSRHIDEALALRLDANREL